MRIASPIVLSEHERAVLSTWIRGRSLPLRLIERARIVVMAAQGVPSQDIARALEVSRPTVQLWRERFLALRLEGLKKDAPRPGRIPSIPEKKVRAVVRATLHTTPRGATHWSIRTMAKAQGISRMAVQRIWDRHGLKPHLTKTFKLSRDQRFVEKLYDVVGLYLNPPEKALVLCVDEKSQIQALDRTQPGLPIKKGRCGTMTHDYKRNGTTTLFAALSMLDGKVIGDCMARHRHQEFIRFLNKIDAETPPHLDLHLIVDNYATPAGQSRDAPPSQIPLPLQSDVEFLVESGRALVSRDYRQADPPRQFPQRHPIDRCDRRLPEMSQPKPSRFRLESFSRHYHDQNHQM